MSALRAFAELNEAGTKIEVHFKYDPNAVEAIRSVPGRNFQAKKPDYPAHWTIPLDLTSCRRLREEFGEGLALGDAVRAWAREEVRAERQLGSIATADDATLKNVPRGASEWLRAYQRADVKMMSLANVLNANQPGVGKTVEVIYAAQEAKLNGAHLVIAPLTLHKDPWAEELESHAPGASVFWAVTPAERKRALKEAVAAIREGRKNVWLIVNPDFVRVESDKRAKRLETASLAGAGTAGGLVQAEEARIKVEFEGRRCLSRDHKGNGYYPKPDVADLFEIDWDTVTLDEFHKVGLGENRNTLFARAAEALGKNARRRFALSGTPMGGKPIRLWGVLYFIEPTKYGSKWRWANEWLEIDDNGFGKSIGGIIPGREDAFYQAHAKHMVRRTRKEALPGLPDKVVINVSVGMTPAQSKLYTEFERSAEAAVNGGRMSADGILAEFARLKQLANARCEIVNGDVVPTRDSGKLPALIERLDGFGFRKDSPEPGARGIVASESKRMAEMVVEALFEEGLNVKLLTGAVTGEKRNDVIDWYKQPSEDARILVMTTQTGGVGLNLGMTGSIHILDETWNPDDQEQLEDRGMRNRTEPLMVLYYRTEGTIQEYIAQIAFDKAVTNKNVMDTVREVIKAKRAKEEV